MTTDFTGAIDCDFHPRTPAPPVVSFRLAVAYELMSLRGEALVTLEKAIKSGYAEKEVRNDPELVNLRNDLRYHKLMAATLR